MLNTKILMFFFVDGIIGDILGLKLGDGYLFLLEEKGRSIVLAILVEEGENRMVFDGRWAERNLNTPRNIGKILNWF